MNKKSVLVILVSMVCSFWQLSCTSGKKNKEMKAVTISKWAIQSTFSAKPDKSINLIQAAKHFNEYPERWNTAFKFLTESDLKQLPLGRIDLSDDVYAIVSEYETKNPEDGNFESHRKYIDVQYIVSGKEMIGLTNDTNLNVVSPYNEEKDIAFYNYDGGKLLTALPDKYFIFFPDDRHRPCLKIDEKSMVRKIVVKIRYN
ncbi:MAG: YhcH/YjgK/YiaL family protein [Saprospiraceae bacterium]